MTLVEIRDAMASRRPSLDGFRGGWASISDLRSNLRTVGLAPPTSDPVIVPANGALPEILQARFYYWDPVPSGYGGASPLDPLRARRLNAIDVMITALSDQQIGLLFSTRTRSYLGRAEGILASLTSILQSADATIKIDRWSSHLELKDEEFFLWLAVKQRDDEKIADDITLDVIAGISSRDEARRTADLKYGVDFERPNFLTAVAESDTLGPIDMRFVKSVGDERHAYEVRVHVDGGFEIRKSGLQFPDSLTRPSLMLSTSLELAYDLIPRFNSLYEEDSDDWSTKRTAVIQDAMSALEVRYGELRRILQEKLLEAAAAEQDDESDDGNRSA
ncbi:hypothetical protein [Pseudoclavibacter sp. 8L]|uniref:hypothetical protein n=1 Tax=Pseudoclavibacter sp. 8L TaxID=2653162 RepID=UPI001358AEC9|nr:hypothetical protein [Pseudoclavibacter sp. 8L]